MTNFILQERQFDTISELQPEVVQIIQLIDIFTRSGIYHKIKEFLIYKGFAKELVESEYVENILNKTLYSLVTDGFFKQIGVYYVRNIELTQSVLECREQFKENFMKTNVIPLMLVYLKNNGLSFVENDMFCSLVSKYYSSFNCQVYYPHLYCEEVSNEVIEAVLQMACFSGYLSFRTVSHDTPKRFIRITKHESDVILHSYKDEVNEFVEGFVHDCVSQSKPFHRSLISKMEG